jgi:hypothetical protein
MLYPGWLSKLEHFGGEIGCIPPVVYGRSILCLLCLFFFRGSSFFFKKNKKKLYFLSFFSLFSLSFSLVHTLWVLLSLMNFTKLRCEGKLKEGVAYKLQETGNSTPRWGMGNRCEGYCRTQVHAGVVATCSDQPVCDLFRSASGMEFDALKQTKIFMYSCSVLCLILYK